MKLLGVNGHKIEHRTSASPMNVSQSLKDDVEFQIVHY